MGAHRIKENEPWQLTVNSTDFFTHEDWNAMMLINDIALIKLPFSVTFNSMTTITCTILSTLYIPTKSTRIYKGHGDD